jgi:hypothetical protein
VSTERIYRVHIGLTFGLPNYSSIRIDSGFDEPLLDGETSEQCAVRVRQMIMDDLRKQLPEARKLFEELRPRANWGDASPPPPPPRCDT